MVARSVPLEAVFIEGNLPPTPYNVVNQEKEYHGEIKVGLTFTPEVDIVTHQSKAHCSFAPLFGNLLSIFS